MKIFRLMAVTATVFLMSLTAFSQNRVFSEFAGNKNITTVYISPAAMRLGLNLGAEGSSEMKVIKNCIKNPQGLEIVTAETPKAADLIRSSIESKIKKLGMEFLLSTTEGTEKLNIYTGKLVNDSLIHDILIETSEENEYTLIYITGDIDIVKLTKAFDK